MLAAALLPPMTRPAAVGCLLFAAPAAAAEPTAAAGAAEPAAAAAEPRGADVRFGRDGLRVEGDHGHLEVHVYLQPRYTALLDPAPIEGTGFHLRRARLILEGAFAELLAYELSLEASEARRADAGPVQVPVAYDAWVACVPTEHVRFVAGRFKVPFSAQWLTSSSELALPERAPPVRGLRLGAVDLDRLAPDRDVGVEVDVHALSERVRLRAAVVNGEGSAVFPPERTAVLGAARVRVDPLGPVPLGELDLERGPPRLSVGVSALHGDLFGEDATRVGAEARLHARGLAVGAEVIHGIGADTGGYVQAAWTAPVLGLTPAARVSLLDASERAWELTAGASVSLPDRATPDADHLGHAARIQAAYGQIRVSDGPVYHQVTTGLQLLL